MRSGVFLSKMAGGRLRPRGVGRGGGRQTQWWPFLGHWRANLVEGYRGIRTRLAFFSALSRLLPEFRVRSDSKNHANIGRICDIRTVLFSSILNKL